MSSSVDQKGGQVWKVYIPHALFKSSCGYISGFLSSERRIISVTSLSKELICEELNSQNAKLQHLGYWHGGEKQTVEYRKQPNSTFWLDLFVSVDNSLACNFHQLTSSVKKSANSPITCILYDPKKVYSSYLLCDKGRVLNFSDDSISNMDTLIYFLNQHYQSGDGNKHSINNRHILIPEKSRKSGYMYFLCILATLLGWAYTAGGNLLNNRFVRRCYLQPFLSHVAFLHQIELRYHQVKKSRTASPKEAFGEIRCLNVNTRLILDMMLGVFVMVFIMRSGATEIMAGYIINWADGVVIWLNNLLDWLMGVPAGLKLNSQLDQFLGRFFHYHIYLWTGYLTLLKPVLAPLLWYSSIVGFLGFSMQLCLLQDVFSTLTIHIYCFYVYAARLYYFQLYGLSSLWRLFRGKKWNVLRRRVDSASYDVDQLFVGTLLFTILLFLLPTTALYYVVFLGLRLLVLSLTGIVSKTVSMINSLPIHGLLLRLIRSDSITGDVVLTVLPYQASRQSLFVSMQTTQVAYSSVIKILGEENVTMGTKPQYTWGSLLHRMFIGELIYPWVEKTP